LRLESRFHEKQRLEKAKAYDRDELQKVIETDSAQLEKIKWMQGLERRQREKEMFDHAVHKNILKEAVETMDVWNAWDPELIEAIGEIPNNTE
jgi:hypothetical protein